MKRAIQRARKSLRRVGGLGTLLLLLAPFAHAQTSEFLFDANGNLVTQAPPIALRPQITGQPQHQLVDVGNNASFLVVATGTEPLSYQWRFNGADISGANADTLLLENVSASDEGEFRVVVSNAFGSVTSAPAFLFLDTDHDGMGDIWEFIYFGTLNRSSTSDFDGDGNSNLQEFQDGTNPTNSDSVLFRLLVVSDAGTVIKAPDQPLYTNGQSVTLTAIPPTNGGFHAWLGDIVTRSNPVTLVMTNNKTVYARFTPITFTWINPAGGDWNIAANWTPNLVPGSNDSPVITSTVTVTLNTPADCADVILGSVAGSSPTLTGTGQLTVRGHFIWTSGTMSGNGRTVIEPGARLTLDNPFQVSLTTRTLELGGETFWTGPGNVALNGAVITNRAGAVFEIESSASFPMIFGASRIDNAGLIRKSFSGGTTTFESGVTFNNSGTVEIQTGALNFVGGGTHSASSAMTGAGHISFSGGTHNLAGLVNVSGNHTFSSGTANLTGNYICTNNTLTIVGPVTVNFSGTGAVAPNTLNFGSPAFNPSLTGSSTVMVLGNMVWISGAMSGSGRTIIAPGATLDLANPGGGVFSLSARTLENAGTILLTGAGSLGINSGAVLTNRAGALVEIRTAGGFSSFIGVNRFDNAGTFRKVLNTGASTIGGNVSLNNYGTVETQTGALSLAGGGTHSGSFDVRAGTALILSGGSHGAGASSSITGAGHLTVSGGTADLAGLVNVTGTHTFSGGTANLTGNYICTNNTVTMPGPGTANFSGTGIVAPTVLTFGSPGFNPTLTGSSTVTVLGNMVWISGAMSGSGRTIIAPGATLDLANPGGGVFSMARTLENAGTIFFTGAGTLHLASGAVITNRAGALFEVKSAGGLGSFPGTGRIDNAGTFRKSLHIGTTEIHSGVGFNNYGTVDIRSGILAANGAYNATANALLNCVLSGITPGLGYGRLQVAGAVTLNGSLSVDFANGFSPAVNDAFTVLAAGTRNGSFANFTYPTSAEMVLSNTPSSVVVRALGPHFATTTLPDAMRNVGYTQQVAAVMNDGPIAYSLIAGALPEGLSFSSSGTISGIPTVFGHSTFTIQAANAVGVTIQRAFDLRVRNLPPEGLISWWRAENNALDSISTNHGVLTNGATFAAGNVGQTFALDGVNDCVLVPDSPNLRPSSVTLEAWAMFNSPNGPVFTKPLGPATGDSFALFLLNGTLHGFIHDATAAGVLVSSPSTLSLGQWHHVAFSFDDSTKEQALYVNGGRVATSQSNRSIGYDNKPVLLGQDINNGNFDFPLNGRIDEASIYNRALSTGEIAAIYLAGAAGKPTNLPYFTSSARMPEALRMVGYTQQVSAVLGTGPITFSAPSGGLPTGLSLSSTGTISGIPTVPGTYSFLLRATDSLGAFSEQQTTLLVIETPSGLISWWRAENNALDSISTNHGVLTNGATFAAGRVGQAFALDGVNDYVHVPDSPSFRPVSVTVETWVKFFATNGIRIILAKPLGNGVFDSYGLALIDGVVNAGICDNSGFGTLLTHNLNTVLGQWYHLAYTFDDDANQQALYVNGALVANATESKSISYDSRPLLFGADIENGTPSFFLNGQIDEPSIYNRALSAHEIVAIYHAGSAGKPVHVPYFTTAALLPDAARMMSYTQQVSAAVGTGTITFSSPSGGLPAGLSLSSNGTISGIPTIAGTHTFVLRVTDSLGAFSDQLATLRVIAPVAAPSGLISWWRGEGNALDSAGTNHGTASNGVVYVAGKVGQAFSFDGINDFVFIPDAMNLRPASITLEAWAQFNGTLGPVLGRSFGAAVHNSYVIWQLNGNINGTIGDALGADVLGVPFSPIAGRWYHVAFTFDDATKQQVLYLDGAVVAFNQSLRSIAYDSHPVLLGGDIDNGTVSFLLNGAVDEAAIYNRALTAREIAAIHSAGIAGKQVPSAIPQPMLLTPELVGANVNLSWTTVSSATYRLEFNSDLSLTNWTPVPGEATIINNRATKLDALTPTNRFYRVRVLP